VGRHFNPRKASAVFTFAIGDIHGSLRKFRGLIARCREYADERPATFVFLGDYIDRGPESAGVVDYLIEMQSSPSERCIALMGNHEAFALGVMEGTTDADHWLSQGGAETLLSYCVTSARDLPRQHVEWMGALPLTYDDGRRFFVHAGVDPSRPLDAQDDHDLLWIREPFLSSRRKFGRLVVHGHTPLADAAPDLRENRLNLDTGAVFGGPLTAAVFSTAETAPIGFLQVD
jgi:serine/threonine protein phosphatase 1